MAVGIPDEERRARKEGGSEEEEEEREEAEEADPSRREGNILAFQALSGRKKKNVTEENTQIAVKVFVFDLLYLDGVSLLDDICDVVLLLGRAQLSNETTIQACE